MVRVLGHNSSILAHIELQPRKERSLIVVDSFDVRIVCIRLILLELCMTKKKKKEEKRTKLKFLRLNFSTVRRSNLTLGLDFT